MNNVARSSEVAKEKVILWIARNPGVLSRVAEATEVTLSFASKVAYGKKSSRGKRVESLLGRMGAPGFDRKGNRI